MSTERISEVTVNCECNAVELEIYGLNPEFIVCHCELCQLLHAGPGFGAHCNGVKIVNGAEFITMYKSDRVPMAVWHFCSQCGTKLFFKFDDDMWKNENDQYVLSVGALHGNEASKEIAKELTMVREAFCDDDMKPRYYNFKEDTEKLSKEETAEYYRRLSQTDNDTPADNDVHTGCAIHADSDQWDAVYSHSGS